MFTFSDHVFNPIFIVGAFVSTFVSYSEDIEQYEIIELCNGIKY